MVQRKEQLFDPKDRLTGSMVYLVQFRTLLYKQALLSLRNWKGTVGQVLTPIVVVLMLLLYQYAADTVLEIHETYPPSVPLRGIPKCLPRSPGDNCTTIIYLPQKIEWVDTVMRRVAEENNLQFGVDVVGIGDVQDIEDLMEAYRALNETITDYLISHANQTQGAVAFTSALIYKNPDPATSWVDGPLPPASGYTVYYNGSTGLSDLFGTKPGPGDTQAMLLMQALDEVMLEMRAENATGKDADVTMEASLSTYPDESRFAGLDAAALYGGIWFYIPPMITFFILLTEIVTEKEQKLRLGMKIMGMRGSMFWAAWFVNGTVFVVFGTLILMATGYAAQFEYFLNTAFEINFCVFFCYGMSLVGLAFFVSTIVQTSKSAQTVGYGFILVGFVFQTVLCSFYGVMIYLLYGTEVPEWVTVVRWILTFYPPFNFSKAYYDISQKACSEVKIGEGRIEKGPGFNVTDFYIGKYNETMLGTQVDVPPTSFTVGMLAVNMVVFLALAFYFDNVLGGDHGTPRPLYFLFTPEYWGLRKRKPKVTYGRSKNMTEEELEDVDVVHEREAIKAVEKGESEGEMTEEQVERRRLVDDAAVRISGLTKVYKPVVSCGHKNDVLALDHLFLSMPKGQIFCLLGHNGAGKTTAINIMTGLFPPTEGECSIFGYSSTNEIDEIRKFTGVCPQHDILWKELTAREHLRIFGRLKGMKGPLEAEIEERLDEVGLLSVADKWVGEFSGGMKRRLSVAIAAIGDPKIIFMDEPTTGMDPVNRKQAWAIIQRMKAGRVIVLTTHAMEEADILGDRVGIMAFGRLRALGNSLHLKATHGRGYRLSLNTSPERSAEAVKIVQSIVPTATILAENAGSVALNIPKDFIDRVPEVCDRLRLEESAEFNSSDNKRKSREETLVHEWSLSLTTLEDVFLEVTRKSNFVYEKSEEVEEDEKMDVDAMQQFDRAGRTSSQTSNTFRGLFRKNFTIQGRQKGTNCCQIVSPVLVLVILILLQVIIQSIGGPDLTEKRLIATFPFPLNIEFLPKIPFIPTSTFSAEASFDADGLPAPELIRKHGLLPFFEAAKRTADTLGMSRASDELDDVFQLSAEHQDSLGSSGPVVLKTCLEYFYYVDATTSGPSSIPVGFSYPNGSRGGMLAKIPMKDCLYPAEKRSGEHKGNDRWIYDNVTVPYFVAFNTTRSMQYDVFESILELNKLPIDDTALPPAMNYLPDAYVTFEQVESSSLPDSPPVDRPQYSLKYTFAVNDNPASQYHRPNNFTRITDKRIKKLSSQGVLLLTPAKLSFMDFISESYYQTALPTYASEHACLEYDFICPIAGIKMIQAMPFYKSLDILAAIELFGSFLYPLALTLQLPIYVYIICLEKEEKLREMMKSMGMKMWKYWVANYIYNFTIYAIVTVVFAIVAAAVGIRFFTQTNPILLVALFLGWGLALVSLSFLIGSVVNSKRASTIIGYVVALLGNIICIILCAGIYGKWSFAPDRSLPMALLLDAQMGFARAVYLINYECSSVFACPTDLGALPSEHPELVACVLSLYIDAVWYLLLALYLDAVLPGRKFGVPKHPCFCFQSLCGKRTRSQKRNSPTVGSPLLKAHENVTVYSEDEDVEKERRNVAELANDLQSATAPNGPAGGIFMNSISKKFHSRKQAKIAVDNVSLAVPRGHTFGLLGENGAGKTTTINMLTGVFKPSEGNALVCGYDIVKEVDAVHYSMGVCPQFDIQWDDLTVEEHILFYARLKGIPVQHEREHLDTCLRSVGLDKYKKRKAGKLSGGMRRRLSVAISLVGHSSIVLLDEPTTGLDPASRRNLWSIIQNAKGRRVILLTTHALDEAELLCDRIGIMVMGRMKALGSPEGLKSRYGAFFRVLMNFKPSDKQKVLQRAAELFPGARTDAGGKGALPSRGSINGGRAAIESASELSSDSASGVAGTASLYVAHRDSSGKIVCSLSDVFRRMATGAAAMGVSAWGVSMVSLEDVFQGVVEEDRKQREIVELQ